MKQIRILLVDEHPEVVKQVETRLSYEEGLDVYKCTSLSQTIENIVKRKPDVLLIDPYHNGFDFDGLKQAKKTKPSMTIIVLTAVVDTSAYSDLTRAGAEYILEKSIDSDELVSTIHKVMNKV